MARSKIFIHNIEMDNNSYDIYYQEIKVIVKKCSLVKFKIMLLTEPYVPTLAKQINYLMYSFCDYELYEYDEVCRKYLAKGDN